MNRKIIHTDRAPAAIGPYSQGVSCGDLLFCAGQIPLDPATGELVKGDIKSQARRVIENLEAVLREGGSGLDRILRLDVYLTDLRLLHTLAPNATARPRLMVTQRFVRNGLAYQPEG